MDRDRVRGVIAQMKLNEKLALVGGGTRSAAIDRLKVEAITFCDGLDPYAVDDPSALALGCTFSPAICALLGKARSIESARKHNAFAGKINCGLILDPMRPDAQEYFSEDPYLTAELLKYYASAGVIGYVFSDALGQGKFVNRTIDSRALFELYLYPLEKAGMYAAALQLDGGYFNGSRVSSSRSLGDIYASYIPADSLILTQYGDCTGKDGVSGNGAYQLGMDPAHKKEIARSIVNGDVFENKLNRGVERLVATVANTHEFYKKQLSEQPSVLNIVHDSTVLLKNRSNTLPTAAENIVLFGDASHFDDAAAYAIYPVKDAPKRAGKVNVFLLTDYGSNIDDETTDIINNMPRTSATVIVLCGGCAVPLPFISKVAAVLYCPYCPTLFALTAMLTKVSPRGKLPFTWCRERESYPRNNKRFAERGDFRYESVYNGHLLFNNFNAGDVLFPFGHGLEYTSYDFSQVKVTCNELKISVEFVVKNSGKYAGTAVCQAYITLLGDTVYGLSRRLAAFKRVALEATENARVTIDINLNDITVYDESNNALVPVGGKYRVDIGLSSADIRASQEVKVPIGSRVNAGLSKKLGPAYYALGGDFAPTAPEIERLLKVPFIKKPDEHPELDPPIPAKIKKLLKHAEKTVQARLLPLVKYKIQNTPLL